MALALAHTAPAAGAPSARAASALHLPGSRAQYALTVQLGANGVLARSCPERAGCGLAQVDPIPIDPAAIEHLAAATVERVALDTDHDLALITIPAPNGRWVLLLAASLRTAPPAVVKPLVGWLDQPRGEAGAQRTSVLLRQRTPTGEALVMGARHEQLTLCGRSALTRTRRFDPRTMSWQPVAFDNLDSAEKQAAPTLLASPIAEPWPQGPARLLHARATSSNPSTVPRALTDGDPSTRWSEDLPGPASGETVLMSAAAEVAIRGFDFALRPTPTATTEGQSVASDGAAASRPTAPRRLWLVADEHLVRVEFPADAGARPPHTIFRVELPTPWHARCVGVVLDEPAEPGEDVTVTIAELRARTEFEPLGTDGIVAALDAGGARAAASAALLSRGGVEALAAIADGWPQLGDAGRRVAMDVATTLPCEQAAPFLVARVRDETGDGEADLRLETARARLRSCGTVGAKQLELALREGAIDPGHVRLAQELSLIAPATAVQAIVPRLHEATDELRAGLRGALSTATGMRRARTAIASSFAPDSFTQLPLVAQIDLLRAVGDHVAKAPAAATALGQVLAADRSFRTTYLLLPVAGHLARGGDTAAAQMLRTALATEASPWLRAQAARGAAGNPRLTPDLANRLADDHPRVRQAVLEAALETPGAPQRLADGAAELLRTDPWTFVREGAAAVLGAAPPSESIEGKLVDALDDDSPYVRLGVVRALGAHGTDIARAALQRTAGRATESVRVRVGAIKAVGQLCEHEATDLLTKLALRVAQPQLSYDRPLGLAALRSLGALHPADLGDRLAPLLLPSVPEQVRHLAEATLREPGSCK